MLKPCRTALAGVLLLITGCSVEPPVPIEADPAHAHVQLTGRDRPTVRVGVAPVLVSLEGRHRMRWPALGTAAVSTSTDSTKPAARVVLADPEPTPAPGPVDGVVLADPAAIPAAPAAAAAPEREPAAELPPREYRWQAPEFDGATLQTRLTDVLSWALAGGGPVAKLGGPAGDRDALSRRADDAGADLLIQAEVTAARAAWVDREGAWFWTDALVFYGLGLPMAWIENEVFEVSLAVRVAVVHARSGQALLTRSFVGRHERPMNDPQRGWSLGGFFFLHPWTLDDDDLQVVYEALAPHAQKDLERQVVEWLDAELADRLAEPPVRALFDGSDARGSRVFALVVGAPGPSVASLDRPPPLAGASPDAAAFAALLRDADEVAEGALVELRDASATRGRVVEALGRLGKRMTPADRLVIYYAGYGWFDAAGKASLLLDGEAPLSLDALADAVAKSVPERAQVVFVLDTSFGGNGGRTYPGAPTTPDGALLALARRAAWQALIASQPGKPAHEEGGSGLFTRWLVAGAKGAADQDADGIVDVRELERYLRDWVRSDARERLREDQVPVRLAGKDGAPARLVRVVAGR